MTSTGAMWLPLAIGAAVWHSVVMALRILQVVTVLVFVAIMWGVHQGVFALAQGMTLGALWSAIGLLVVIAVGVLVIERRRSRSRQGKARPE